MSKVRMTSSTGEVRAFDLDTATRMCRIMKAMKSRPWTLPITHEFIDGYVRRKSDKKARSGETE